jgi:hypothetical protein
VRGVDALSVERPLDAVGELRDPDVRIGCDRWAAMVARERQRDHVVVGLERCQYRRPDPPGARESVQQNKRRADATAMNPRR